MNSAVDEWLTAALSCFPGRRGVGVSQVRVCVGANRIQPVWSETHSARLMADESAAAPLPMRDAVLRTCSVPASCMARRSSTGRRWRCLLFSLSSFIQEAISRASAEAQDSGDTECEDVHLEKILPQVMSNQFARAPSLFLLLALSCILHFLCFLALSCCSTWGHEHMLSTWCEISWCRCILYEYST